MDNEIIKAENEVSLIEMNEQALSSVWSVDNVKNNISIPIAEFATLGSGVASLLPAFRTVTQTATVHGDGLYRLVNAGVGDALKAAKDGNFWGALKTASGSSKMLKIQEVGSQTITSTAVSAINPATLMMAVALSSIEHKLDEITEMQKKILDFLEIEKESEIEASVQTLSKIVSDYKNNWDNKLFIASNHELILTIQWNIRKHMISYQKRLVDLVNKKQPIVTQSNVKAYLKELQNAFKYYRLSLYIYAEATFMEIMLSGNFKEENILAKKAELSGLAISYRDIYTKCSEQLETFSKDSIESNVVKGLGSVSNAVGKAIGSIPIIKEGPVDEFLQTSGKKLKTTAKKIENNSVEAFAALSNPRIGVFTDKLNDMTQIYNHTSEICFDKDRVYLITQE